MRVLVVGGAGYIGSHVCKKLAAHGHLPVTFDDLSIGHEWAVKWGPLIVGDLGNREAVRSALRVHRIEAVIHLAAHAYVGESMLNPRKYFENNTCNTLNLLGAMLDENVKLIVFSSSCATYGHPKAVPISEDHSQDPVNPYGDSKLFVEHALRWYAEAYGIRYLTLRYFNAAGADPDGEIGEAHSPETHLIPLALEVAAGKRSALEVFGTDYPTPDGTAVRDYVHVLDLADGHVAALNHLTHGKYSGSFNLGTGRGATVREVLRMVEEVTSCKLKVVERPRRPGDPAYLTADASRAAAELGWTPSRSDLRTIVETAWQWSSQLGRGRLAAGEQR